MSSVTNASTRLTVTAHEGDCETLLAFAGCKAVGGDVGAPLRCRASQESR